MTPSERTIENVLNMFLEDPDDPDDGCWTWLGREDKDGYGRHGKQLAHRYVWTILKGPIEADMDIDHTCNNRLCVRPDHLEITTHQENIRRRDERRGSS